MIEYELIWACDDEDGIGKEGIVPWNVPQDLKNFREITTGGEGTSIVIMGRKTWESIPRMFKPLKDRHNIIITNDFTKIEDWEKYLDEVGFVDSFQEALELSKILQITEPQSEIFVIGGGSIYQQAINRPECVGIHETLVEGNFKCDTFIPEWNSDDYDIIDQCNLTDNALYLYWRKKGTYIDDSDTEIVE